MSKYNGAKIKHAVLNEPSQIPGFGNVPKALSDGTQGLIVDMTLEEPFVSVTLENTSRDKITILFHVSQFRHLVPDTEHKPLTKSLK